MSRSKWLPCWERNPPECPAKTSDEPGSIRSSVQGPEFETLLRFTDQNGSSNTAGFVETYVRQPDRHQASLAHFVLLAIAGAALVVLLSLVWRDTQACAWGEDLSVRVTLD